MIHDGQRPNAPMWTQKVFNGDAEEGELAKKVNAIIENEIINKLKFDKFIKYYITGITFELQFVDGVALHWYIDTIPILGNPDALDRVHESFPDKFMLYTEVSIDFSYDIITTFNSETTIARYYFNVITL